MEQDIMDCFAALAMTSGVKALEELTGAGFFWGGKDFCRTALFYYYAFVHEDYFVGCVAGKGHFVGNDYHGGAFGGELVDYIEDFAGKLRV